MPVVDSWCPVVRLVFRDYNARARALAERIVIVCSTKIVAANYIVDMLAIARNSSGVA